MLDFIDMKY